MNLTSSHNSAEMEDDAFHHATLAGGKEMLQAPGSTGPLQGLVCAGTVGVQATLLSKPMGENCLWRSISCASRASLAACMMPSSSARAKAVVEQHPSSARPALAHRVCRARLRPWIRISTVCFSTLWPANIRSRARHSQAADKPAARGWRVTPPPNPAQTVPLGVREMGDVARAQATCWRPG